VPVSITPARYSTLDQDQNPIWADPDGTLWKGANAWTADTVFFRASNNAWWAHATFRVLLLIEGDDLIG
jgi:hypothetical protein